MKELTITKDQLDADKNYIGEQSLENYKGHIRIAKKLGLVKVKGAIKASGGITAEAGSGIEAGEGIEAGWGIEAGSGIKAGWGIKAGEGIEAGWGIDCKLKLNISLRIFAGLCLWREPTIDECKIQCGKLESGKVCFGELVETGLPEEKVEPKYRPWTAEEGVGKTVRMNDSSEVWLITSSRNGYFHSGETLLDTFTGMLLGCTQLDGSPCGVLIGGDS